MNHAEKRRLCEEAIVKDREARTRRHDRRIGLFELRHTLRTDGRSEWRVYYNSGEFVNPFVSNSNVFAFHKLIGSYLCIAWPTRENETQWSAYDVETGESVAFYNPRNERKEKYFAQVQSFHDDLQIRWVESGPWSAYADNVGAPTIYHDVCGVAHDTYYSAGVIGVFSTVRFNDGENLHVFKADEKQPLQFSCEDGSVRTEFHAIKIGKNVIAVQWKSSTAFYLYDARTYTYLDAYNIKSGFETVHVDNVGVCTISFHL